MYAGFVVMGWAVWVVGLLLLVCFKLFAYYVGLFGVVSLVFAFAVVVYLVCCFTGVFVVGLFFVA